MLTGHHLTLVLIGAICCGATAAGAKTKVSGDISYTLTHLSDVSLGTTKNPLVLSRDVLSGTIKAAVPGSRLDQSKQVCVGATLVDAKGTTIQGHGSCDAVDADGDAWWLVYSAKGPSSTWTVVGGTGKYKKLRGTGMTAFRQQLQGVHTTQQTWEQSYTGEMTGLPK